MYESKNVNIVKKIESIVEKNLQKVDFYVPII